MRVKATLYIGLLLTLVGCTQPTAKEILQQAQKAHGGTRYQKVSDLTYDKATWTLSEEGDTVRATIATHHIDFIKGISSILWEEKGEDWKALLQNDTASVFRDKLPVADKKVLAQNYRKLNAAQFVFWQPFRILETNPTMSYEGEKTLFNGWKVHHITLSYPNEIDRWSFFFDSTNYRLKATGVFFRNKYTLITNDEQETKTGLYLHHKRTSYGTDSLFVPFRKGTLYKYTLRSINYQ